MKDKNFIFDLKVRDKDFRPIDKKKNMSESQLEEFINKYIGDITCKKNKK